MSVRVCLAGATGWAGSALARRIAQTDDMTFVAAVSRILRLQTGRTRKQAVRRKAGQREVILGALLAIRKVGTSAGLHRGLDSVLDLG